MTEQFSTKNEAADSPLGLIFLPKDKTAEELSLALMLGRGPFAGLSPEQQMAAHKQIVRSRVGATGVELTSLAS
jgi:hypothetical protein